MSIGERIKQSSKESIFSSILLIILGIITILFPHSILSIISYLIGAGLVIRGIIKIYYYFKNHGKYNIYNNDLTFGLLNILFGILYVVLTDELQSIFRILIGMYIIYEAIVKISMSAKLSYFSKKVGFLSFLLSVLIMICGVVVIFNKGIVITTIGYILVVFSVMNIIENIVVNKNVKKIEKYLNDNIR